MELPNSSTIPLEIRFFKVFTPTFFFLTLKISETLFNAFELGLRTRQQFFHMLTQ